MLSAATFTDRLEPLAKDIEIDGERIHYAETGEGTPIILCHGIPLSMASWQDLFFLLGERHRAIAIDLPGYGRSSKTGADYSLEGLARSIVRFCDSLGIDRCHVAGSSFGAAVAIELALTAPERVDRLILFNSVGIVGGTHSVERIVRSGLIRFLISRLLIRHRLGKAIFRAKLSASYATIEPDAALVDHYFDLLLRDRGDRSFLSTLQRFDERRLQRKLPRMERPVLSIWGAQDRVLPVRNSVKLQRLLPDCWSFVLAGVGHLPHEEEPARCARLIDSFLKMPTG